MLNETNTLEEKIPAPARLFGASLPELVQLMERFGQPVYRARQIYEAIYNQRLYSLDEITTLPAALREALKAAGHAVGIPEIVQTARSVDGTERYLVRMADGETVETVWMPGGDGGERGDGTQAAEEEEHPTHDDDDYKRATICISSQVGCAVNCQFCLTAKLGIRRNLTPGEIAGQVAAVLNRQNVEVGRDRINLVFMGMGEPFLNYAGFMAAVGLLTAAMRIPESRMTVSTSGILPGILDFAKETVRPKLAVSLNASNDVVRESIMPITRKWNIGALLEAIATVPLRPRERVTFEYVMLGGINDQVEHANELIALLKNMQAKINLIVWNSGPDMPFHEPAPQDVAAFQKRLRDAGIPAFIRRPRGRDIYAACGQLKRTLEQPVPLVAIAPAATLPG
ncbi:23S rRNA (adenine(2503)-C(2))-methyltransferase RlmN [Tunturiibacter lichenicola]|uniref:23S rRNA (adenine(2503)-C(2))-methyltransferase RlmN n=1 Tax=Tunturiibacter lichenicola TaxID=2051959 RepID=UPI0021B22E27|nr:23S rRNA (adenine(2503)-C(2))-methyltransferase RlmN [Edaphobacter lichenicola]